jgi:putative hydrolase of the HAD superfamily
MTIKAIIFDYGGVLIHMVNETPRQQLADRLGVPLLDLYKAVFNSEAAVQGVVGQATTEQLWQSVADAVGVPYDQISGLYWQFWAADGLNLDVIEHIRSLRRRKKAHYKIGLLSNANDDLRAMLTERWRIADLFDDMVISAEVGIAKPDPHVYQIALERLGVQPAEAVFVDDVAQNVEGAQAVGMYAVQFKSWLQMCRRLARVFRDANGR